MTKNTSKGMRFENLLELWLAESRWYFPSAEGRPSVWSDDDACLFVANQVCRTE